MHRSLFIPLLSLLSLVACVPSTAIFIRTNDVRAPARPAGCAFEIVTLTPSRPFQELGEVETQSYVSYAEFRRQVGPIACARGANAVVVRGQVLGSVDRGTLILVQ